MGTPAKVPVVRYPYLTRHMRFIFFLPRQPYPTYGAPDPDLRPATFVLYIELKLGKD
jgi:hypothetical protein